MKDEIKIELNWPFFKSHSQNISLLYEESFLSNENLLNYQNTQKLSTEVLLIVHNWDVIERCG